MNAEIKLSHDEVLEACLQYLRKHGWEPQGKGSFVLISGYYDQRDNVSTPDTVTFSCKVSNKAVKS